MYIVQVTSSTTWLAFSKGERWWFFSWTGSMDCSPQGKNKCIVWYKCTSKRSSKKYNAHILKLTSQKMKCEKCFLSFYKSPFLQRYSFSFQNWSFVHTLQAEIGYLKELDCTSTCDIKNQLQQNTQRTFICQFFLYRHTWTEKRLNPTEVYVEFRDAMR